MPHPGFKIYWGPYNHQALDAWVEAELQGLRQQTFGPFGADWLYRPELSPDHGLADLQAERPELLLVLEPPLRLIGPELLALPCPIVACTHAYPLPETHWQLFDALIALDWPQPLSHGDLPVVYLKAPLPTGVLAHALQTLLGQASERMSARLKAGQNAEQNSGQRAEMLRSLWRMSPVQREALPLLSDPLLARAYQDNTFTMPTLLASDLGPGQILSEARGLLNQQHKLQARERLAPLLYTQTLPEEPFPVSARAQLCHSPDEIWRLSLWEIWLATEPEDLRPLLGLNAPPAALAQMLYEHLIRHNLPVQTEVAAWIRQHWPDHARLQLAAIRLTDRQNIPDQWLQSAFEAYQSTLSEQPDKNQLMHQLLAHAPQITQAPPLLLYQARFDATSYSAGFQGGLSRSLQSALKDTVQILSLPASGSHPLERPQSPVPRPWRQAALTLLCPEPAELLNPCLPTDQQGLRVGVLPWGHGIAPRAYADFAHQYLDEVWVFSQAAVQAYRLAGVPEYKIFCLPIGVDTTVFCPTGFRWPLPSPHKTHLLYTAPCSTEHGIDLLLKAYLQAFSRQDPVCLVIKDLNPRDKAALDRQTRLQHDYFLKQIEQLSRQNRAEILLVDSPDMSEQELASLYRACQLFVHPYRVEAIGQLLLQAMASGLPVITSRQGVAQELCDSACAWFIPSTAHFLPRIPLDDTQRLAHDSVLPNFFFEPSAKSLALILREAYQLTNRVEIAQAARKRALQFDLRQMAQKISARLQTLLQKHAIPAEPDTVSAPVLLPQPDWQLDFDVFQPLALPQFQPDTAFGILWIGHWQQRAWQTVLQALELLLRQHAQFETGLQITLVPIDDTLSEARADLEQTQLRICSLVSLRELPSTPAARRELYQAQSCFVDLDPSASGHWHLMAQAQGIPCIGNQQAPFLQPPYAHVCQTDNLPELTWRISTLLQRKHPLLVDALAIREHLRSVYHKQTKQAL